MYSTRDFSSFSGYVLNIVLKIQGLGYGDGNGPNIP